MHIFPAIDLFEGKAVRLVRGDYARMTVYSENPPALAEAFERAGAEHLHLVDLEGAKSGDTPNFNTVSSILAATKLKAELGGGVRSEEAIERYLDVGVWRVILGTAALRDPALLDAALARYGARIAVGVDARGGRVAVSGWRETSAVEAGPFCASLAARGVSCVIHTDISRDGALCGVNLAAYRALLDIPGLAVVASGGVAGADDLRALAALGVHGAIVGRALYEGRLDVAAALEAAGEEGA